MAVADTMGSPHILQIIGSQALVSGLFKCLLHRPEKWNMHPATKSVNEVRVVVMTVVLTVAKKTILSAVCGLLQGALTPQEIPRRRLLLLCKGLVPNYELPWPEGAVSHSSSSEIDSCYPFCL